MFEELYGLKRRVYEGLKDKNEAAHAWRYIEGYIAGFVDGYIRGANRATAKCVRGLLFEGFSVSKISQVLEISEEDILQMISLEDRENVSNHNAE